MFQHRIRSLCSVVGRTRGSISSSSSIWRPARRWINNTTGSQTLAPVRVLRSWDRAEFDEAFLAGLPARLPRLHALPPACSKWFVHRSEENNVPSSSELDTSFWSDHESTAVPLELTSRSVGGHKFRRVEAAPLKILLTHLSTPTTRAAAEHSIYLAQCDLLSLPASLQADIPTPSLLASSPTESSLRPSGHTIKGDIYASSLWLGRPPTYTPLHRDPNPNLFVQLAGHKVIRLLPPEVGDAVFADVQTNLDRGGRTSSSSSSSSAIRGEEMMDGSETTPLHDAIWMDDPLNRYADVLTNYARETTVGLGDALFIPKGWWHSVKGVGRGVTASANWWFR
jgi:hypothetical protein